MKGKVMTVLGPMSPERLGITLPHEHILIDLRCWLDEPIDIREKSRIYEPVSLDNLWWIRQNLINRDNLMMTDTRKATEEIMEFKRYGGKSIVDVTSIGIGRDPIAIRNISRETGINVIMGSGYYTATAHPPDMDDRAEGEIAKEIIKDIQEGVGETGIRAGIIGEIGLSDVDNNPNEEKSLRAAACAQKETGTPLIIHPSAMRQCKRVIEILEEEGANMKRVIMSHTESYLDESMDYTYMIADAGLHIEYDLWGREGNWPAFEVIIPSDTQKMKGIEKLIENGYQDQVLLSQDVCMKIQLMSYGGYGYAHLLRDCLPIFRHAGISEKEIQVMLVENPKRILTFV